MSVEWVGLNLGSLLQLERRQRMHQKCIVYQGTIYIYIIRLPLGCLESAIARQGRSKTDCQLSG